MQPMTGYRYPANRVVPGVAIVADTSTRSRYGLRASQLVSATSRQLWQTAPFSERSSA